MESISSFTYCKKIQNITTPDGATKRIIDPIQELTPVAIPSNFSFAVSCSITGVKPNTSNHLKIIFEDPTGKIIESLDETSPSPEPDPRNPEKLFNMQLDLEFQNTVLEKAGIYNTRIIFNDNELGNYKINVHTADKIAPEAQ